MSEPIIPPQLRAAIRKNNFTYVSSRLEDEQLMLTLICPQGHPAYEVAHNKRLFQRYHGRCPACAPRKKVSRSCVVIKGCLPLDGETLAATTTWQCISQNHVFHAAYSTLIQKIKNYPRLPVCLLCETEFVARCYGQEMITEKPPTDRKIALAWRCVHCGKSSVGTLARIQSCSCH